MFDLLKEEKGGSMNTRSWFYVLAIIVFLLLCASVSRGESVTANQATVAWDAVTTNEDGNVVPPEEISYKVYARSKPLLEPVFVGSTQEASYTFTFDQEAVWIVGAQTVRTIDGQVVGESDISWSDNPERTASGEPIYIMYFKSPASPLKIKVDR